MNTAMTQIDVRPERYILDANHNPVVCDDLFKWARWFETADRRVAHDMDEGEGAERIRVSTVFLGLDHNFAEVGPPVLWETMVFGGTLDGEQARYASREAALRGHQDMCRRVTRALKKK
jgi:hypothetical protein